MCILCTLYNLLTRPTELPKTVQSGIIRLSLGDSYICLGIMLLTPLPISRVEKIASRRNITMTQVAVAWTLSREGGVKWRCLSNNLLMSLEQVFVPWSSTHRPLTNFWTLLVRACYSLSFPGNGVFDRRFECGAHSQRNTVSRRTVLSSKTSLLKCVTLFLRPQEYI